MDGASARGIELGGSAVGTTSVREPHLTQVVRFKNRHSPKTIGLPRSGIDRVTKPSTEAAAAEDVPSSESITPYDEAHLTVYLRLLDADAAGATVADMARIILGIDPVKEPERAQRTVTNHLRRARWMTEAGYRSLLGQ